MKTKMYQAPIRWGIIGCGDVTEIKSGPAFQKTKDFSLAGVMRRDEERAKDYARRHQVDHYYSDADKLIENKDIDAIYIATPPDTHKLYGLKVAAAGKPCCIEKPLAPTYNDSVAIYDAFESQKTPLFVAYYRRSLPLFNKIKALIASGEIGKIRQVNWSLSKPASDIDLSKTYNWRTDKAVAPAGYFDDLASHGLDLFAYYFGDFEVAKGVSLNQQGLYSSLDAVTASWKHKSGVIGSGQWNFGSFAHEDKVIIQGDQGEIHFSVFTHTPIEIHSQKPLQKIRIAHPQNIQHNHIEDMRDTLLYGKKHPSNGQTALHTSWVMEEILNNK